MLTSAPTPATSQRARTQGVALVLGVSLFFALLFGAQNYVRDVTFGPAPIPALRATLFFSFSRWLLYAALVPLVAWLAGRVPVRRRGLFGRLALHAVAAAGFSIVHSALLVVVFRIDHFYPPQDSMMEAFHRIMLVFFSLDVLTYCGVSGAFHAFGFYRDARERELKEAELRASLTEARLDALRSQLNPHFLFNTLNATSALALTGQVDQVVETLSALSELLRVSLDRDQPQEVTLERELEILAAYLEIQHIRFGDRLTLALDIDARCTRALVPSMVLQPLLENALEHGVAVRPGPGRVTVRATRAGDRLTLRVEDTGPGFAATGSNGAGHGIGLVNTAARLEQLYGGAATIEWGNLPAGGAFVELALPLKLTGGSGMIRTLLVDDEPLARRGLRVRLEREPDVTIVGEADDGPSAVEAIRRLAPDLLFLDVQMPGLDGFQVLEHVWSEQPPHVVFVTAHDTHALKAFEFHALDYLLKPYSEARFLESLRRARAQLAQRATSVEQRQLEALLESLALARGTAHAGGRKVYAQRFSVRDRERIVFVRADELDAVLAAGNYVELVVGAHKHLLRVTLAEMEEELDPARFARIHRSTIVNLDRVQEVRPDAHGDGEVLLAGGAVYRMSRAYRERLLPGGRPGA